MSEEFIKRPSIKFEPEKQEVPTDSSSDNEESISKEAPASDEVLEPRSKTLVESYNDTIEFMKFVENLLRENAITEVTIDPQEQPELWIAMERRFDNPSKTISSQSYYQVIDQLEAIDKIEAELNNPRKDPNDILKDISGIVGVDNGSN